MGFGVSFDSPHLLLLGAHSLASPWRSAAVQDGLHWVRRHLLVAVALEALGKEMCMRPVNEVQSYHHSFTSRSYTERLVYHKYFGSSSNALSVRF